MEYLEENLCVCIANGDIGSLSEYLKKGLDANHAFRSNDHRERLGKTLLELAIVTRKYDIAKLLIENKADTNLRYIVNVSNYAYTLKKDIRRDRLKQTSVYPCLVKNDLNFIKLLIQGGLDVNIQDDRGCTPLWHAVDLNNYEMAKAFTQAPNCDVNIGDAAMLRPLHIAAMHTNPNIVSLLIRNGSLIDPVQVRGWTPLCLASRAGCYKSTKILLLNGADPNHVGLNGHTPLSMTIEYGSDRRIPEMLLEAGAYVDVSLVKKCRQDKMNIIKYHPDVYNVLKEASEQPRSLRTFCGLAIRKCIVNLRCQDNIIEKVEKLPLPYLLKEYLLMAYI